MPHRLALALALLCDCRAAPAAPPAQPPPPVAVAPPAPPAPAALVEAPATGSAPWTQEELRALDRYRAFSDDGQAFALAEPSPGAGVPVLTFFAATTSTIEKRLVLDSLESRRRAAAELAEDGFPRPGPAPRPPPGLALAVAGEEVIVTMAGRPAARRFKPFGSGKPSRAELLAASADGLLLAVRAVAGNDAGEFGPMSEVRIVRLFE